MREKYMPVDLFTHSRRALEKRRENFLVVGTSYTKKIKLLRKEGSILMPTIKMLLETPPDNGESFYSALKSMGPIRDRVIFNEEERGDIHLLQLIKKARADAGKYKDTVWRNSTNFDANKKPSFMKLMKLPTGAKAWKVDIKSAYWEYALKAGIISQETNNYLNSLKDNLYKTKSGQTRKKRRRLIALGSIASTERIEVYVYGQKEYECTRVQNTKPIYKFIQNSVDEVVSGICKQVEGNYVYVDCLFSEREKDTIVDLLADSGFDSEVEETRLRIVDFYGQFYIESASDGKRYYVPRDDIKPLIEGYIKNE